MAEARDSGKFDGRWSAAPSISRRAFMMAALSAPAVACRSTDGNGGAVAVSSDEVERALRMRVFFAHQSVGQNILTGIQRIVAPRPVPWKDAYVGTNGQPLTKLTSFRSLVTTGLGKDAEYALFKFCFMDFSLNTNVAALFDRYRAAMQDIEKACPRTTIIHITTPLTVVQSGLKAAMKRVLGFSVYGEGENQKRHAFNQLLRGEYRERQTLFDLANIESGESLHPQRYEFRGESLPMLTPAYSDDGGHLNLLGQRIVAAELLRFTANRGSAPSH